jgi:hypothetical protein
MFSVLESEIEATSEKRRPSSELAKPSTFQRMRLTNSKTRAGNRRDCYACARRRGKKIFSRKSVPVATRTTPPLPLDEQAEAVFIAKVKTLAPKYRTELLPPKTRET